MTKDIIRDYVLRLGNATSKAKESMSEVASIELHRRIDTAHAIIKAAEPRFIEQLDLANRVHAKKDVDGKKLGRWSAGLFIVGLVLNYFLRDDNPSFRFDFNFGTFISLLGIGIWIAHLVELARINREIKSLESSIEELLYRWRANGGNEDRFFELRKLVKAEQDINHQNAQYRRWRYEIEADLLDNVLGEAISSWGRPTPPEYL